MQINLASNKSHENTILKKKLIILFPYFAVLNTIQL
jgi:hypothetical protein